jgi:hypothetical protein
MLRSTSISEDACLILFTLASNYVFIRCNLASRDAMCLSFSVTEALGSDVLFPIVSFNLFFLRTKPELRFDSQQNRSLKS